VRSTSAFESVTEAEKFWVACFRVVARERREVVRSSWVVRWWFSRVSEALALVLVAAFGFLGAKGVVVLGRGSVVLVEFVFVVEDDVVVPVFSRIDDDDDEDCAPPRARSVEEISAAAARVPLVVVLLGPASASSSVSMPADAELAGA